MADTSQGALTGAARDAQTVRLQQLLVDANRGDSDAIEVLTANPDRWREVADRAGGNFPQRLSQILGRAVTPGGPIDQGPLRGIMISAADREFYDRMLNLARGGNVDALRGLHNLIVQRARATPPIVIPYPDGWFELVMGQDPRAPLDMFGRRLWISPARDTRAAASTSDGLQVYVRGMARTLWAQIMNFRISQECAPDKLFGRGLLLLAHANTPDGDPVGDDVRRELDLQMLGQLAMWIENQIELREQLKHDASPD